MTLEEFKNEIKNMSKKRLLKVKDTYMWKQGNLDEDYYLYLCAINDELRKR